MLSKFDTDHGTPERNSAKSVTLQIDGMTVTVPAGTSMMRAASGAGVKVPKLCATDSIEPFGSCRLCLVEIEGRKGYPASCTTNCEDGMVVRTPIEQACRYSPRRDGTLHFRSSARLLDLFRQRQLRVAGHGGRGGLARSALRLRGQESH